MEIKTVSVDQLKPWDKNPRNMNQLDFDNLVQSIKEFGFVEPVVVNKDNTVIGGHQRIRAAVKAGLKEVPVHYVNLSKKKEKALNLALNKIHGEWDSWGQKIW